MVIIVFVIRALYHNIVTSIYFNLEIIIILLMRGMRICTLCTNRQMSTIVNGPLTGDCLTSVMAAMH